MSSINHAVSDLIAIIKNGQMAHKKDVVSQCSKLRTGILDVLKANGFIEGYEIFEHQEKGSSRQKIKILLGYDNDKAVIKEIKVISKPGKRVYCQAGDIPRVYNGLGMVVISTSSGIVSDYDARSKNVGGELLLSIF